MCNCVTTHILLFCFVFYLIWITCCWTVGSRAWETSKGISLVLSSVWFCVFFSFLLMVISCIDRCSDHLTDSVCRLHEPWWVFCINRFERWRQSTIRGLLPYLLVNILTSLLPVSAHTYLLFSVTSISIWYIRRS